MTRRALSPFRSARPAGRPVRHRWAALLGASALGLSLVACGADGGAQPDGGSASSAASTPVEVRTPEQGDGAGASPQEAPPVPETIEGTDLATDLEVPWGIEVFDDGALLVSERDSGRILRVGTDGEVVELGTVDAVPSSEGGMLGVTLSPDASQVYAYYSTDSANRLVRFPLEGELPGDGSAGGLSLGAEEVLVDDIPMAGIHNGGQVRFGPDDMLYVATGDATNKPDAQDPQSLAGKILRLTPEGEPAEGNPWDNEVYSIGHRNVQGLAWDGQGRMWASEFGDSTWDELNMIEAGNNYGWPEVEGVSDEQGNGQYIDPAYTWQPSEASPSGLTHWRGSLWMASLRGNTLWQIPLAAEPSAGPSPAPSAEGSPAADPAAPGSPRIEEPIPHWKGEYGRLRAVAGTDDGPLYVGTSNLDGRGEPADGDDRLLRVE